MKLYGQDYRECLRNELRERQQRNSRVSLRAFAKFLGISPATLSGVLNGKRRLGNESIERISNALALDPSETKKFRAMVLSIDGDSIQTRQRYSQELMSEVGDQDRNADPLFISVSQFRLVADWFHLAILEAMHLAAYPRQNTMVQLRWLSDHLSLPQFDVSQALQRLASLGIVRETSEDGFQAAQRGIESGDQVPSSAIREHHRQYLEKSMEALEQQTPEQRDFSGIIFQLNPQQLDQARQEVQNFRERMLNLFPETDQSSVYRMSVQLFSLSKLEESGDSPREVRQ